jgi:hypothetical protein
LLVYQAPASAILIHPSFCTFSLLQAIVAKTQLPAVFKKLHAQQKALGVLIADVKSHVLLEPMTLGEQQVACRTVLETALVAAGYWRLAESHLLGSNPLAQADGQSHTCPSIELRVEVMNPGTLAVVVQPQVITFRHLGIRPTGDNADLKKLTFDVNGSLCRVLPNLQ